MKEEENRKMRLAGRRKKKEKKEKKERKPNKLTTSKQRGKKYRIKTKIRVRPAPLVLDES